MQQRKVQQRHLSSKCDTLPNQLVMNQGDKYRSVQEERLVSLHGFFCLLFIHVRIVHRRMIIDRALPSVSYGKGRKLIKFYIIL